MQYWTHRGLVSHQTPENTIGAFKRAIYSGADGLTLSLQTNNDGDLVVFNDPTLERLFFKSDIVKFIPTDELLSYNMKSSSGEHHHIPLLSHVVDLIEQSHSRIESKPFTLNIEIKHYEAVASFVSFFKENIANRSISSVLNIVVSSFHAQVVSAVKRHLPNLEVALCIDGSPAEFAGGAEQCGADAVHINHNFFNPILVKDAKARGLTVRMYDVNSKSYIQNLVDLGVEGIITTKFLQIL